MKLISSLLGIFLLVPTLTYAGDGATIVFREGHVAYLNNGYSTLVEAYKKLNESNKLNYIVELKIESNPFLINLGDVVILCRDRCTSLEVVDPRKSTTNSK